MRLLRSINENKRIKVSDFNMTCFSFSLNGDSLKVFNPRPSIIRLVELREISYIFKLLMISNACVFMII